MEILSLQIAQALFRVCSYIKQKDLRGRIEAHSVYLLETSAVSDFDGVKRAIATLEQLVFLGEEVGEIQYHHGQILHSQFANLKNLLNKTLEQFRVELAIADIFTGDYEKYGKNGNPAKSMLENNMAKPATNQQNTANQVVEMRVSQDDAAKSSHFHYPASSSNISENGSTWQVERQELIAQKVKEFGNAAMKDLIAAFPDVSERTLRYDLKKLCERQIVERIGNGPASYYVLKNKVFAHELRTPNLEHRTKG